MEQQNRFEIERRREIEVGQIYMYKGDSTKTYTITKTRIPCATDYEKTGKIVYLVEYQQNYTEGYPKGFIWHRLESDFLSLCPDGKYLFTLVE